jgi:DNA-binding transcriptional LysR family regulator
LDVTAHQLRCFLAVAEELHFGHAAARLGLRSSSVSEQIATLERRLSRTLFHRSSRRVELTEDGRQLVPLAKESATAMDAVLAWADDAVATTDLRVGLMVSHPMTRRILAVAAKQMTRVTWHIRQLGFSECYGALGQGDVDCVFVTEIGDAQAQDIEVLPLWEEGCVVILPDGHRLAGRTSVGLVELAEEVFISDEGRGASSPWLKAATAPNGFMPRVLPVARGVEEVLASVGAGLGINIAGASARETYARPGLHFVPVVDAPAATTYLCLPPGRPSGALEEFIRLAVATAHARP